MKTLRKELFLFISAVSISSFAFAAPPNYTVTDLGAIPALQGASNLGIGGASVSGTIAGSSDANVYGYIRAFYFNGTTQPLGTLGGNESYGTGLSGSNIVGYADTASNMQHAFFYDGVMHDLGTLGGGNSRAYGINSNNNIVGEAENTDGDSHAFLHDGSMHDLGTLGGTYSVATAINDGGMIAGYSATTDNAEDHAFLYSAGFMQDLGTLGGSRSIANNVSSNGLAVGYSWLPDDTAIHAFLYDGVMRDIGTLGGDRSEAISVNSQGWIVGWSDSSDNSESLDFLYDGEQMYSLNSLLVGAPGLGVSGAISILDNGDILALGYDINNEAEPYNHLLRLSLTTVPVPASAWLFGSCLTGLISLRRKFKNS